VFNEGDNVRITVHNDNATPDDDHGIPEPVSLMFPGQQGVVAECTVTFANIQMTDPSFCHDAAFDGDNTVPGVSPFGNLPIESITYTFTAKAGTYAYHSGVSPQIQVDMGLVGAMIVRPNAAVPANAAGVAYSHTDPAVTDGTAFDREYLFILSEMDPKLHYLAEHGNVNTFDNSTYQSVLFFINGRNAPDTLAPDGHPALHHQPYGSVVQMYPGERVLLRVLNMGRNPHPLHLHGNHFGQIARDGNVLLSDGGTTLGKITDYTLGAVPMSTADLIFEWTAKGMGWDIYNAESPHANEACDATVDTKDNKTGLASAAVNPMTGVVDGGDGFHDVTWEWCPDHGKKLPIVIPENQDLTFGGFYGGSPYLGDLGSLPIGEGGLNPGGAMVFMWHSHSERELTNNDVYPGGMLTMMLVERCPVGQDPHCTAQ
jgi:FtsP/CotA-like multicopper oxidase with cupredoxin domain